MFERFVNSPWAVVVKAALEEATRRGDRRVGTEHLLLGLLHDPGSAAARALDTDLEAARSALDDLDRTALATIGIDTAGLGTSGAVPSRKRPPMTSAARSALTRAVRSADTKARLIDPRHLLATLLDCAPPDPAAELMGVLGIDRAAVRTRMGQLDA